MSEQIDAAVADGAGGGPPPPTGRGWVAPWWNGLSGDAQLRVLAGVAGATVITGIWVVAFFTNPGVHPMWKFVAGSILAGLGAVVFFIVVAVTRRRFEAVERWLYALGWLVAASFVPIAVAVFARDVQGWGLVVLVAWLLALLPGFLYLQFRTVQGRTMLEEYLTHLERLAIEEYGAVPNAAEIQPPAPGAAPDRVADHEDALRNLYVRKFRGVFGSSVARRQDEAAALRDGDRRPRTKLRGDTLWPVLWVTLLVAIGWTAVLAPDTVFDVHPFGREFALPNASGAEDAIRFGFLGAYFYVIQMLVRRYFQKDLKPDAYISATLRFVTVPLIVVVVHTAQFSGATAASNVQLATAFIIGVFPEVGLEAIREFVSRGLGWIVPSLRAEYPLSQIDGLNLFYQSRLLEEGIEDMQNLATADFVDLLLQTRIPVGRMVDWMDQAHLLIRLPAPKRKKLGGTEDSKERHELRNYGVRCATDLEMAFKDEDEVPAEVTAALPGLRFVLKTLRHEPNMKHVRAWKGRSDDAGQGGQARQASRVG